MGITQCIAVEPEFIVLYKAACMHTVPLHEGETDTLLHFAAQQFPEILDVHGKKPIEGGVIHRLDYETQGLVLVARTQPAYNFFQQQQAEGRFIKEYRAAVTRHGKKLPGFPPPPSLKLEHAAIIESGFRSYGPGRKAVRPVPAGAVIYRTAIISAEGLDGAQQYVIRLSRGFRHQIRCHLAWLGSPIQGDALYGAESGGELALQAIKLNFIHPKTKKEQNFAISS